VWNDLLLSQVCKITEAPRQLIEAVETSVSYSCNTGVAWGLIGKQGCMFVNMSLRSKVSWNHVSLDSKKMKIKTVATPQACCEDKIRESL
jgi:hypothetical protein